MKPINDDWLKTRLASGSKSRLQEFRATLMHDEDRRNFDTDLCQLFEGYLLRGESKDYFKVKSYLRDLKSSEDGKLFSQGVKEYAQLEKGIDRFQQPSHPSFQWNRNYQEAKSDLIKLFSKMGLRMVNYIDDESIRLTLPKTSTHCGYTYIQTGRRSKGENLTNIYQRYLEQENLARKEGSFNKPILPGCRTQASGAFEDDGTFTGDCKHKTRLISMVDMFVIIAELRFAAPLQKAMARWDSYAGGKQPNQISSIISNMRYKFPYFISLDYSSFDQSISDWLIYDVFDIIRSAFVDADEELLGVIITDFIEKNFVMGDWTFYVRKGVPSGSMFTQIVDSIANVLMVSTYLKAIGSQGEMIVMGDDNLVYSKLKIDKTTISSYIMKNFGVEVGLKKTTEGTKRVDPEFLSRFWRPSGQEREKHAVISKLLYPERFRNYKNSPVTPELVLFAYILTYPITMWRLMDLDKFYRDFPNLSRRRALEMVDSRYIPGALAFIREYTSAA